MIDKLEKVPSVLNSLKSKFNKPYVDKLVTDPVGSYDTKTGEIEKKIFDYNREKYSNMQEFNKLTSENFGARLKQVNLASKNDIAYFIKKKILMIN